MTVTFQEKQYTIPTGYSTLSWGKYLEIKDSVTNFELIARVTGIPYDEFLLCNDVAGVAEITKVLGFLKEQVVTDSKPFLITIDDHVVMTPKSLDKVTFAQYQDMVLIIGKDMPDDEKITTIVAIASMKEYLGAYDSDKLPEMINTVKACTVQSVVDSSAFFFRNMNALKNGTRQTSSMWGTLKRKLLRALKSLSGLGFLIFYQSL